MKYSPSSEIPRSWICTMLRCESAEWMRASVSSIFTKRSSSARSGRIRLIATSFSKPSAATTRPLKTSAMPPTAICSKSSYWPNFMRAADQRKPERCPGSTSEVSGVSVGLFDPDGGAAREHHQADDLQHRADADDDQADVLHGVAEVVEAAVVGFVGAAEERPPDQAVPGGDDAADHQAEADPMLHLRADVGLDIHVAGGAGEHEGLGR